MYERGAGREERARHPDEKGSRWRVTHDVCFSTYVPTKGASPSYQGNPYRPGRDRRGKKHVQLLSGGVGFKPWQATRIRPLVPLPAQPAQPPSGLSQCDGPDSSLPAQSALEGRERTRGTILAPLRRPSCGLP